MSIKKTATPEILNFASAYVPTFPQLIPYNIYTKQPKHTFFMPKKCW